MHPGFIAGIDLPVDNTYCLDIAPLQFELRQRTSTTGYTYGVIISDQEKKLIICEKLEGGRP